MPPAGDVDDETLVQTASISDPVEAAAQSDFTASLPSFSRFTVRFRVTQSWNHCAVLNLSLAVEYTPETRGQRCRDMVMQFTNVLKGKA